MYHLQQDLQKWDFFLFKIFLILYIFLSAPSHCHLIGLFFYQILEKMELTPGEHQLLDHIVAAHQKYTIPLEEAKKFVCIHYNQPALIS